MAARLHFGEISSYLEKKSILDSTVHQVLRNLRGNYQKFGKVSDDDLLALSAIFDETLEKALELVEGNKVTYYHTKSDIAGVYQVEGNSSKIYTLFPSVNYCSCPSFKYQVSSGSQVTCKHVLATIIADAVNAKNAIEVTNEHLNDLLLMVKMMNEREDWNNRNAYSGPFVPPNPLRSLSTAFPAFGQTPVISQGYNFMANNWAHVPPQTMPWGTPPESQPQIMKFTAGDYHPNVMSFKRRCESPMDTPPPKMLVTEEKMAAHLRNLRISDVEPSSDSSSLSCQEDSMESERLPKLVISEELKNIKTEPIIPESILKKLEKPEMALVLWQPPPTDLDGKLKELQKLSVLNSKKKENENKEDTEMDVGIDAEGENTNVFRPIDPVPMPPVQNEFIQPVPQFHGYSPFLQNNFS